MKSLKNYLQKIITMMSWCIIIILSISFVHANLLNDLYIYNPLEDNSSISIYGNNFTLIGDDVNSVTGKVNNGIKTSTSGTLALGNYLIDYGLYQEYFSLNMWFNTSLTGQILDGRGAGGYYAPSLYIDGSGLHFDGDTTSGSFAILIDGTSGINDNIWHMLTITKIGGQCSEYKIYLDSILMNITCSSSIASNDSGLYDTKWGDNYPSFYSANTGTPVLMHEGVIDEFGAWNRDLNQSEIDSLYNSSFGMTYPFGLCIENWINNNTECNGYNFSISYYDANSCSTNALLPIDNGTIIDCEPSYIPNSPFQYTNFNGAIGNEIISQYGKNMTKYNTTDTTMFRKAYKYDSSYLDTHMNISSIIQMDFTIMMWLNATNTTNRQKIYGIYNTIGGYIVPILEYNAQGNVGYVNDALTFQVDYDELANYTSITVLNTGLNDGNNHYLVITKNGGLCANYSVYIDAIAQNITCNYDGANSDDTLNNVSKFAEFNAFLGKMAYGSLPYDSEFYVGTIDNFGLYDKYFTLQNITQFYNEYLNLNICNESWIQYNTSCNGYNYTTYYLDSNNCNTTINLPMDNGSITNCSISCIEDWIDNSTICDGFNITVQYYDNNSCNTTFNLPFDNGTIIDCSCHEYWNMTVEPCIDGVKLIRYTDANKCNTTNYVPNNNNTNGYCNNSISLSSDTWIFILFAIFFVLFAILGAFVHSLFFGLDALIVGVMLAYMILQHFAIIVILMMGIILLVCIGMWLLLYKIRK